MEKHNNKAIFTDLHEGHKKKRHESAQKEEFCAMARAFKKLNNKKKAYNKSHHDSYFDAS
eukprot:7309620-Ditylum_brightwellii.AAC.1